LCSFQDELTDVNPEELEETGAALWAINFALLLDDAEGSTLFRRFLKTIYCEENMRFWQDTQKLTSLPESEVRPSLHDYSTTLPTHSKSCSQWGHGNRPRVSACAYANTAF